MLKKKLMQTWFGSKPSWLRLAHGIRMCSRSSDQPGSKCDNHHPDQTNFHTKAEEFLDNLDENQKRRKKRLESEIEEYHLKGFCIPRNLSSLTWHHLLTVQTSRESRLKYLTQLERNTSNREKYKLDQQKDVASKCDNQRYFEFDESVSDWVSRKRDYACHRALVHGLPLVIDLGYSMTYLEQSKCLASLAGCYKQNMNHCIPYNLHFTSTSTSTLDQLNQSYHSQETWFASFHEKACIDLFSSENLVYLSPRGLPIEEFDAEKVYVIGAYVDMSDEEGDRTISRARQFGVEACRLPLGNFQRIYHDLGLNTVMEALLEAGRSRDWQQAMYKALVYPNIPWGVPAKDGTGPPAKWRRKYEADTMPLRHRAEQ